ncbi:hypothetical protein GQ457_07G042120 [Hibiscus cannabinus]
MYCDHALLLQIFGADCCPEIKLMSLRPNPLKIGSCGSEGDESFVNSEDLLLRCFRLAKNFASSSELRNVVNGTISRSRVSHGVTCERPEMDWYNANTDGVYDHPLQQAAAGGVRNDQGEWIFDFSTNLDSCSILLAKLWMILIVLNHA